LLVLNEFGHFWAKANHLRMFFFPLGCKELTEKHKFHNIT